MTASASHYQAPLGDIQFLIERWLQAPLDWQRMPAYEGVDTESSRLITEAIAQFCQEVLAPLNASADLEGCRLQDGKVQTPDGFASAWQAYVDAGWPALACEANVGGQGLPQLLDAVLNECIVSANHAWAMYPGILHGAYACLHAHASPALRETYLPKLVSGEWLATMCLTEPQAGSDLGLLRTQAKPQADGSYHISGNKIFISGGDHDLTGNIVHLVLARLPDAPVGSKGLSLFLVPKFLPDAASEKHDVVNAVFCDGIEKKMGIKGSATCAMRFENATGWLIGQPHRGLSAMFIMMNSARLHVGLQGLAHAEMASQLARHYAMERRQMRAQPRPAGTTEAADPIHLHPAVRRRLLDLRVWTEGMRAIGYWAGHLLDLAEHAPEAQERAQAEQLATLLTPVIKAFFTEKGFELASEALQVFGGYGYIHEYRIEQTLRDSRIAMLYEGTNQIQALDLLQRKVLPAGGLGLEPLLEIFREEAAAAQDHSHARQLGAELLRWSVRIKTATVELAQRASHDPDIAARAAEDYLRLIGTVCIAFAWCRSTRVADESDPSRKRESAQYFFEQSLIDAEHWLRRVQVAQHPLPAFVPID